MPTEQNPTPPPTPEPATPDTTAEEAKYWDTLESRLDSWFDKKIEKYRTTGTARMGKTTLPELIANFVFGKQEENKK